MDGAVDLRGVAFAAALCSCRADRVNDDLLTGADTTLEAPRRDRLLALHEAVPALLFDLVRHGRAESVGGRALYGLVAKAANPVERRRVEPVEQKGEFVLGLAREADDEGGPQRNIGTDIAPRADAIERLLLSGRP